MEDPAAPIRIRPLEPPYEPGIAETLSRWMPPASKLEPLALFRTLAVHEELSARMRPLGAGILAHGLIPPRLREVMIHRTCALTGAEYEWGVHAIVFGDPVGLSAEQLSSTVHGSPGDPCWSDADSAVLCLADELHATSTIGDATFAQLRDHFDDAEIIELVVTCGWYHTIAFVIAAAGVPFEPWAARFPPRPEPSVQPDGNLA